jgi:hypothetical protein
MDISKLPRMSKTDTPPNDPAAPDQPAPPPSAFPVVNPAAPQPVAPIPFVTASAWCPNCGAPLQAASKFCNSCGARIGAPDEGGGGGGMGVEGWISIGVGLFLIFMAPMGFQYWSAKLMGKEFRPYAPPVSIESTEKVGFLRYENSETGAITDVYYRDTAEFWSDSAVATFAVVLILDGIVIAFFRKRAIVAITFALTLAATLFNLGWLINSFAKGYGFPPISFLAVLFGGFMCYHQWQLLQWLRATSARPTPRTA